MHSPADEETCVTTPQEIQERIERTRESLSSDVDRLSDKVSPKRAVERRVDGVKSNVRQMREKVMGLSDDVAQSAQGTMQSVGSTASSIGETVGDAAATVGAAAARAPHEARTQAQGNPLAAGLIAFGVGWLLSSLAPATRPERQLAEQAGAKASDLAQPVAEAAQQAASNLREPAQHAVEQIKTAASDAVTQTADEARSAVDDVREPITP
jgi:uncharacterized protein YoxC